MLSDMRQVSLDRLETQPNCLPCLLPSTKSPSVSPNRRRSKLCFSDSRHSRKPTRLQCHDCTPANRLHCFSRQHAIKCLSPQHTTKRPFTVFHLNTQPNVRSLFSPQRATKRPSVSFTTTYNPISTNHECMRSMAVRHPLPHPPVHSRSRIPQPALP